MASGRGSQQQMRSPAVMQVRRQLPYTAQSNQQYAGNTPLSIQTNVQGSAGYVGLEEDFDDITDSGVYADYIDNSHTYSNTHRSQQQVPYTRIRQRPVQRVQTVPQQHRGRAVQIARGRGVVQTYAQPKRVQIAPRGQRGRVVMRPQNISYRGQPTAVRPRGQAAIQPRALMRGQNAQFSPQQTRGRAASVRRPRRGSLSSIQRQNIEEIAIIDDDYVDTQAYLPNPSVNQELPLLLPDTPSRPPGCRCSRCSRRTRDHLV